MLCVSSRSLYTSLPKTYYGQAFSSTCHRKNHYKTLGVPPQATKAQIKSHFYQLSKRHHPDVAQDTRSKDIFNAISEAYAILSDDRERRAYDRSLLAQQHPTHPQTYHPRSPANKTPRATHAWEYSARPRNSVQRKNPSPDWQHTHPGPQQHSHPGQHYTRPDPSVLYHDVGSHLRGTPRQRADAEERAMDRVRRASGLTRALQVVSLIVFSAVMFGGVGNASRR